MPADPATPTSPPPLFSSSPSSSSSSASTKLLIIALIIVFFILASISFHLFRHYISRRSSSYTPPPSLPRPPSSHTQPPTSATSTPPQSHKSQRLSSIPLFPLSSPASVLPKSPDCAVCLSPFRPRDDLRLLPTCRHAFHLHCIDMWLKSTPSCPLCRSPAAPEENTGESSGCQVEIDLSYSFGSSVEHPADEEVETAVDPASTTVKEETGEDGEGGIQGAVAEEDESGGRGWLREYLDRVASSASTSFNSLTFSGRLSSHRFDSGSVESIAGGDCRSWDVEGVDWVEESGLAGIYRWFVGM